MDFKTKSIIDKVITVNREGIYKFNFKNSAVGVRIAKVKIERIPKNDLTSSFNTRVYWKNVTDTTFYTEQEKYLIKREYISKAVLPTIQYFVNSGSNATFKGGKSRITFPVSLPKNTVEWYYQFSATRDKSEIEQTIKIFNLAGKLTTLIDKTGTLSFGIDALSQPPGANYCDIYLLNHENSGLFKSKVAYRYYTSGTRENIKSGLVKMSGGAGENYYFGIKNPDVSHGVHVAIEIVAVVLNEEWGIKDVQKYDLQIREEPYLKK